MSYDHIIIDGNNFLCRAYYTKAPSYIVDGVNVAVLQRFLNMMKHIKHEYAGEIIFAWDRKVNYDIPNFRKELTAYKMQRPDNEHTQNIADLCDVIFPILESMGIKCFFPYSLEADDTIKILSEKYTKNIIISGDKDLLQLISDNTHIYNPGKKEIITLDNFSEKTDTEKNLFVLVKSIMGDATDNFSGLYKYGIVRAKKLSTLISEKLNITDETELLNHILNTPASDLAQLLDFLEESISIIQNNIKICWLKYPEKLELYEREMSTFNEQYTNNNLCRFKQTELKALFKKYNFSMFLYNFGEWQELFNNNQTVYSYEEVLNLM